MLSQIKFCLMRAKSCARMRGESVEEGATRFELRDRNVLVGFVRLIDRARADHHRRDAGQGKQSGLGAKSDLTMLIAASERIA